MFRPNTKNHKVLTPDGYKLFEGIQRLEKDTCEIVFDDGRVLGCSVNHPVSTNAHKNEYTKALELVPGQKVFSEDGYIEVVSVTPTGKEFVYDLINVEDTLCYYTDGILSHNCHFLDSTTSSTNKKTLDRIDREQLPPVLWFDETLNREFDEEKQDEAAFKIWELPEDDRIYSLGSDVGTGVNKANSTIEVIDITDLRDIRQVAEYACNTIHPSNFTKIIKQVASMYNCPPLIVERNNDGGGICDSLYEDANFKHRLVNYNGLKTAKNKEYYDRPGVSAHNNTKNTLVLNARFWIDEMECVTIRSSLIKEEMNTFGKRKNNTWGKLNDKVNDDRLIALYYALMILVPDVTERYIQVDEYDENDVMLRVSDAYAVPGGVLERVALSASGGRNNSPGVFINPEVGGVADFEDDSWLQDL